MKEKRGELLAFIRGDLTRAYRQGAEALMARHAERLNYVASGGRYHATSANELKDVMTQLYIALSTAGEQGILLERFKHLGNLALTDVVAFDAEVEFLRHDVLTKSVRRAWDEIDRGAAWTAGRVDEASNWLENTPEGWRMPLWAILSIAGVIVALLILGAYL